MAPQPSASAAESCCGAPSRAPDRSAELVRSLEQARALFQLFEYEACLSRLGPWLEADAWDPELLRLAGSALCRLGRLDEAIGYLERAQEIEPSLLLAATLLATYLRAGTAPEAPAGDEGALGELSGAAAWLRGQQFLRARQYSRAAGEFSLAASRFASSSPRAVIGERLGAAYVGQAVSSLLAGHFEAAQQAFGRVVRGSEVPAPLLTFARQLFEVAEACRELEATERLQLLEALGELVAGVRLRVAPYDGRRPVELHWENLG
jgi:tetratricopeptide (TPR) repeat protein